MKKQYKHLSDYHINPHDPELPFFERFISAKILMERWGIDFIQLRQLPISTFFQTKPHDSTIHNPYLLDHPNRGRPFDGIKKVTPVTKEDFEQVMYDFYTLARYEFHKPEIVKDRSVCPQLEKEFVIYHPQIISNKKQIPGKNKNELSHLEQQLDDSLKEIFPELEKFYAALVNEIDLGDYGTKDSINEIGESELHRIATDYFDRTENEYKVLKKLLVQKEILYTLSGQRRRMITRNFLQEYLKDHPAMNNKKIQTSKEALHNRYNKINRLT